MNKENVAPNRSKRNKKLNQKLDQELKWLSERADAKNTMSEIQEIYELIKTQDDFIEMLTKDSLKRGFKEGLEVELMELGRELISKEKVISKGMYKQMCVGRYLYTFYEFW